MLCRRGLIQNSNRILNLMLNITYQITLDTILTYVYTLVCGKT